MRPLATALPALLLLASLPLPGAGALVPDPNAAGSYGTTRAEYSLGIILVDDPYLLGAYTYPVQLHGEVTYPTSGTDWPVLLFLHGRHGTCAVLGVEAFGTHVCPKAGNIVTPVNSYQGYRYIADNLASHGYAVVSVDANQVNDRDLTGDAGANARAQLVLATLDAFAGIDANGHSTPALDALQGNLDLSSIGLMGHSRGGEGVAAAIALNAARTVPYDIEAVFALAPTDFGRHLVRDTAFATLLPYCDGDVYDLEGSWMFDDARYLSESDASPDMQVLAMGANHNFYNTVWTGDDWGSTSDSWCNPSAVGSGRDSAVDQRRHGLGLIASFLRLYAGGETAFLPLWTGAESIPSSLCPGGTGSCDGRLLRSFHAAAGSRRVIEDTATTATATNDLGGAVSFSGFTSATTCLPASCPAVPTYGQARQLALSWSSPGAAIGHTVPAASQDVSAFDVASLRIGVDPTSSLNGATQAVQVTLADGSGASDTVSATVAKPPGGANGRKVVLSEARYPLADFSVDLTDVVSVTVSFPGASGRVQLTDIMLQQE